MRWVGWYYWHATNGFSTKFVIDIITNIFEAPFKIYDRQYWVYGRDFEKHLIQLLSRCDLSKKQFSFHDFLGSTQYIDIFLLLEFTGIVVKKYSDWIWYHKIHNDVTYLFISG